MKKDNISKWRNIPCSKSANSPEIDTQFNIITIKMTIEFFLDIGKIILHFIWKDKGTRIAKTKFKEQNERNYSTLFQKLPYSYNNQDCVVLVEEQIHGSMR